MRRTLALLTLALALAACSDDDGGRLDIADVRIVKVRGDQSAVAGTADAAPLRVAHAGPSISAVAGDWTPEPLVGRIEAVGARTSGISGPSMLPPDMLAHWHLDPEAGTLLAGSTPPDDSLHIVNRWAPSTKAGEYTAVVRRILADGSVHEDARWTLVVEPGAVANLQWHGPAWLCTGDEVNLLDLVSRARDAHNNDIDLGTLGEDLGAVLTWKWLDRVQNSDAVGPEGSGLEVIVPDLSEYNFWPLTQIGYFGDPDRTYYAGGLRVWLNGHDTGYALAAQVFAKGHCPR